jgi:single-strand DNA-binding protein
MLIEISGRIYVNAYKDADGEAKASLNCHVNNIKIHSFGKQEMVHVEESNSKTTKEEVADDLPF